MADASTFLKWEVSRKGVKITGCLKSAQGVVAIPSELDGTPVREIGDGAFGNCADIESIVVPATTQTLGRNAFQRCRSLKSVKLPEGLVEIPDGAFQCCYNLVELDFPSTIRSIGAQAFFRCQLLPKINLNERLERIGANAFEKCLSLQQVILPNRVTEVGDYAFAGCVSLRLFVAALVSRLGAGALSGCLSLTDVKIYRDNASFHRSSDGTLFTKGKKKLVFYPAGKKDDSYTAPAETVEIGAGAFEGVKSLVSVTLGSETVAIGARAFQGCGELERIAIGSRVKTIDSCAFQDCSALREIELPDTLEEIASGTFSGCSSLRSFHLPHGLQRIGASAFEDCSELRKVVVSSTVVRIERDAFNGCSSLTDVTLSPSLEYLGDSAFEDCVGAEPETSLQELELPEGLREIGAWCFSDASYLRRIKLPSTLEKIGVGAFAFCPSLVEFELSPANPYFTTHDGALYTKDGSTLLAYPAGLEAASFHARPTCRAVAASAFSLCKHLQRIELPSSVERIGRGAFSGAGLKDFSTPSSVVALPDDVFWGCSSLESATLPLGLRHIGARAFRGCVRLRAASLPSTLVTIGDEAFFGCASLERLALPGSVAELRGRPFGETTSLSGIDVAPENRRFMSADGVLFSGSGLELLVYPSARQEQEYAIPSEVATISSHAFGPQRFLTTLRVPPNVTTIEEDAIDRRLRLVVKSGSFAHRWVEKASSGSSRKRVFIVY